MSITQISDLVSAVCVRMNVAAQVPQFLTFTDATGLAWLPNMNRPGGGYTWSSDPSVAIFFTNMKQARDVLARIGADENSSAVPLCALASWLNNNATNGATGAPMTPGQTTVTIP